MPVLTPQQQTTYFATEGKKANPLSPLDWLQKQGTPAKDLPSLLPEKTLDPEPEKTLPTSKAGRLVSFYETLQKADELAMKKRLQFAEQFGKDTFKTGGLGAADFTSVLASLSKESTRGKEIRTGLISAQTNEIERINSIAVTAQENGADDETVAAILAAESEVAATKAAGSFLTKKKEGDYFTQVIDGDLYQFRRDANGRILPETKELVARDTGATPKNVPPEVIAELQAAQKAIEAGAPLDAVKRRFMEAYPERASLFNEYTKTF